MRLTTPRVESSSASPRTLKRRSGELEQVRDAISKGSSLEQLQHEVKALTKEDRQSLLQEASIADGAAAVSANDVLAMKADLAIPWNKLRILRRLKTYKFILVAPCIQHWVFHLDGCRHGTLL